MRTKPFNLYNYQGKYIFFRSYFIPKREAKLLCLDAVKNIKDKYQFCISATFDSKIKYSIIDFT